jgi:hypothetical protein
MAVERGSVDHGTFGNIAHRESIEPFLCDQFNHRFLQEFVGAPNAQVGLYFVRHISLFVAYVTKDKY